MKPMPISEILRRIRPLSRENKIRALHGYIACEKVNSIRWKELVAALKAIVNQDLKAYVRQAKKERAA